ncbi:MAG: ATP synthase subunit I [Nitrospirota bacterium]
MRETVPFLVAFLVGVLAGAVFFGGLWWTIRRALLSDLAGLWFAGSFLVRAAIALAGFYVAGQGDWRRLICSVAGFLVARLLVVRFTRSPIGMETPLECS